jgi:KUP system potassium uptake protein
VFLTGSADDVPGALLHNLKHNRVLHAQNIVLTVETEDRPRLPESERVTVEKLSGAFSRVRLRFGFMENPHVPRALAGAGFDPDAISYFLTRRAFLASAETGMPLWQDHLFIALARSASDASRYFCIPVDRAVEVGSQVSV